MFMNFQKSNTTLKKDISNQPYVDSIVKSSFFSDLIFFSEVNVLHGSFDNHYGLFYIKDNTGTLPSIVDILNKEKEKTYTNIYNFPLSVRNWFNDNYPRSKEYISNYNIVKNDKIASFVSINDLPKLPKWFDGLSDWENHSCSSSTLNQLEYLEVIRYMSLNKHSDILFKEYFKNIEINYESILKNYENIVPSLEKPIEIILSGNDDLYYKKVVSTIEDAVFVHQTLKLYGSKFNFIDLMKKIGLSSCS